MSEKFDAYYRWLGIPPKDQPPNHYRLLGVEIFEDNAEVIETAAERQATYLHEVSSGPHVKESQKLLNEVAAARLCLLNPEKKAAYDEELRPKIPANVTVDALGGQDSPLNDLPWDDLEPFMKQGSSASDTVPRSQASSETLPLPGSDPSASGIISGSSSGVTPAPSSGVHTVAKSLMPKPKLEEQIEPEPQNRTKLWLAIGGGAIAIAAVLVLILVMTSGDDNGPGQSTTRPSNPGPDSTAQTNPDKKNGQKKEKDDKPAQPRNNDHHGRTNPQGNGTNMPPKNGGNHLKQPDKGTGTPDKVDNSNGTGTPDNGTGTTPDKGDTSNGNDTQVALNTANGNDTEAVVEKGPMKPDEFLTLRPEVTSARGTKLTVLDDNSILAEGGSSEDEYTIKLESDVPDITAVKIIASPLGGKGPGFGRDGGFAIIEVKVVAAPADKPGQLERLTVSGLASEEVSKTIEKVIDGDEKSGFWPVRRGAQTTSLTMFMKEPIWYENGTLLYIRLNQHEKLGHFSVAVSNAPELAGKKTRIEATLPLHVNLGGAEKRDPAGTLWQQSAPFDGGAFGHVGGKADGHDGGVPLTSWISGIEEFRATLPDGKYNVRLYFSGRYPRDVDQRAFDVSAQGIEVQRIQGIPRRLVATKELLGVEAKDGGLTLQFTPVKGETVLNGLAIYPAGE